MGLQIKCEQENGKKYMSIYMEQIFEDRSFELNMVEKNHIQGLLRLSMRTINNMHYIYYDTAARQQLSQVYKYKKITWDELENIIYSLDNVIKNVNEYMLDINSIILDPDTIYMDLSSNQLEFAYYISERRFDESLRGLFDYIVENYDHTQQRDKLVRMYEIYQKIIQLEYDYNKISEILIEKEEEKVTINKDNHEKSFIANKGENYSSLSDGGILIKEIPYERVGDDKEEKDEIMVKAVNIGKVIGAIVVIVGIISCVTPDILPIKVNLTVGIGIIAIGAFVVIGLKRLPEELFMKVKAEEYEQPYILEPDSKEHKEEKNCNNEIKNEEVLEEKSIIEDKENESSEGHTILISDYVNKIRNQNKGIILRADEKMKEFQDIEITSTPCVIGSMAKHCDKVIENELVSRIHMCVIWLKDSYYIEDMNSTNGTYINERKLLPNERVPICNGDCVKVATNSYIVEINQ